MGCSDAYSLDCGCGLRHLRYRWIIGFWLGEPSFQEHVQAKVHFVLLHGRYDLLHFLLGLASPEPTARMEKTARLRGARGKRAIL